MKDKDRIVQWIEVVLREASKLDNDKGIEMMHQCGGTCSKGSLFLKGAQKIGSRYQPSEELDLDKVFEAFKTEYYDTPRLTKEGNKIFLVFEECTCPMVKEGVTNPFLCHCTTGYSKRVFETLFGRPVEVRLLSSILRGGSLCKQEIVIMNK